MIGKTINSIENFSIRFNFYSILKMTDGSIYIICSLDNEYRIRKYTDKLAVNDSILSKLAKSDINNGSFTFSQDNKNYVLLTDEEYTHFTQFIKDKKQEELEKEKRLLEQKVLETEKNQVITMVEKLNVNEMQKVLQFIKDGRTK